VWYFEASYKKVAGEVVRVKHLEFLPFNDFGNRHVKVLGLVLLKAFVNSLRAVDEGDPYLWAKLFQVLKEKTLVKALGARENAMSRNYENLARIHISRQEGCNPRNRGGSEGCERISICSKDVPLIKIHLAFPGDIEHQLSEIHNLKVRRNSRPSSFSL